MDTNLDYYDETANNSYTGFSGSGESGETTQTSWSSVKQFQNAVPGSGLSVVNDGLLLLRPYVYKKFASYSQELTIYYKSTYQNAPEKSASRTVFITDITITNNFLENRFLNYVISIKNGNNNIIASTNASSGETSSFSIPSFSMSSNGLNVSIWAFSGCTSACIQNTHLPPYQGYTTFLFRQ